MIKFWWNDFDYIQRLGSAEPFGYLFYVRGESANYLINKYQLNDPRVCVYCYTDKTIFIGIDKEYSDSYNCDEDDVEELYNLLKPIIDIDLRNYEDYMCDEWYIKDSRWE